MKLADKTIEQLQALRKAIEDDPQNQLTNQFWKYKPSARRRLDKVDREIAERLRQRRLARGDVIDDSGYSGRQSNKR